MNRLSFAKQIQIIELLIKGSSSLTISRTADVTFNTIVNLMLRIGTAAELLQRKTVVLSCFGSLKWDEILTFKSRRNEIGEIWTWVATDAESKLVVSWFVVSGSGVAARAFFERMTSLLNSRIRISDCNFSYRKLIEEGFNLQVEFDNLDPPFTVSSLTETTPLLSESQPSNIHIKKIDKHLRAIALHFVYYNFVSIHNDLGVTPAMKAGLTEKPMTLEELIN